PAPAVVIARVDGVKRGELLERGVHQGRSGASSVQMPPHGGNPPPLGQSPSACNSVPDGAGIGGQARALRFARRCRRERSPSVQSTAIAPAPCVEELAVTGPAAKRARR